MKTNRNTVLHLEQCDRQCQIEDTKDCRSGSECAMLLKVTDLWADYKFSFYTSLSSNSFYYLSTD